MTPLYLIRHECGRIKLHWHWPIKSRSVLRNKKSNMSLQKLIINNPHRICCETKLKQFKRNEINHHKTVARIVIKASVILLQCAVHWESDWNMLGDLSQFAVSTLRPIRQSPRRFVYYCMWNGKVIKNHLAVRFSRLEMSLKTPQI